jgi:hypothetical protein
VEQRQHARYQIWFPVQVDGGDLENAMAINHNIGAGGMLIALSAELKTGTEVAVTFRLPPDGDVERRLQGQIVRIERNNDDPDGVWPYRMAIAFDQVAGDLVPFLEKAVGRISEIP